MAKMDYPISVTQKLCMRCGETKPAYQFCRNRQSKSGLQTYCKTCQFAERNPKPPLPTIPASSVPALDSLEQYPMSEVPPGILNGVKVPRQVHSPCAGMWTWRNKKNWCVIALHHSSEPAKMAGTPAGDAWIKQEKAKCSERDWLREHQLDFTIRTGDPFFSKFNRAVHVQPCEYDPDKPLIRGWDFGRARPACVWAQLSDKNQLRILSSYLGKAINIFDFAPVIVAMTNAKYPGAKLTDYGDPSGAQETDKGATTAILLHQFKIKLHFRFSYVEEGLKLMEQRLLMDSSTGEPGLIINSQDNQDLIDGFAGGYVLDTGASGKDNEGRMKNSPKKDGFYEHLMDAARYLHIGLYSLMPAGSEDDEPWKGIGLWRSNDQHAAHKRDRDNVGEFCT